jgi:hypothetical protein
MGIKISKDMQFLGVPLITVRNVLKAWQTSRDAADIARRANIRLDPRIVMVLLEELRDRGLLVDGPSNYRGLTEKGDALSIADARARTSKATAWKKFDEFLAACTAINARADLPFCVDKVWLFGSMIDLGTADVGDIDFVVETERRVEPEVSTKAYKRTAKELGLQPNPAEPWSVYQLVEKHLLYGPRKHPLLSPAPVSDLVALACPCQLVFTRDSGRALPPILPKHPMATVKKGTVRGVYKLDDLFGESIPLRPLPTDLTNLNSLFYDLEKMGPWPEDSYNYRAVRDKISESFQINSKEVPNRVVSSVVTDRLDFSQCDTRRRCGLLTTVRLYVDPETKRRLPDWLAKEGKDYWQWESLFRATYGVVVERSIQEHPDHVIYSMVVVSEVYKTRFTGPLSDIYDYDMAVAHYWFYLLAMADLERIRRRDAEAGITRRVVVSVTSAKASALARDLTESLSEFMEPETRRALALVD